DRLGARHRRPAERRLQRELPAHPGSRHDHRDTLPDAAELHRPGLPSRAGRGTNRALRGQGARARARREGLRLAREGAACDDAAGPGLVMKAVAEETRMTGLERSLGDAYREKRSRDDPRWLVEIRRAGRDGFRDMGSPTVHDEAWRYTNVAPIRQVPFQLAVVRGSPDPGPHPAPFAWGEGVQLVFINGRYSRALSSSGPRPAGLELASLKDILAQDPESVEPHLAQIARDGNAFAAVNAAFLEDGAFVRIPARTVIADPIHLVFLSEPAFGPTVSHPRTLVIAEAASQAYIVETYV